MAYVSQEDKKKLAPQIKAVLKKYGMKGTLAIRHHSSLVCKIKEGDLDIIGAKNESMVNSRHYDTQYNPYDCQSLANRLQDQYVDVNTYWIEDNYGSNPTVVKFLQELKSQLPPSYSKLKEELSKQKAENEILESIILSISNWCFKDFFWFCIFSFMFIHIDIIFII